MLTLTDKASYNKAVDEFSDMIYRIAYQNLHNKADAEDVMQEVFIKLLKSDKSFKDYEHLKAWLIRVTVNKCIDFKRSFWQRSVVPIDEQMIHYDKDERKLMEEIFKLPPDYRNIIYLYYYESYTIAEIAKILGKNENTVNSKLQRGRKKLKTILQEENSGYETRTLQKSTG